MQQAFRRSDALFRAFVGGRGAGKSWCGAYDLIRRARPDRTYLVGSPTGVLMGDTTFPTFKQLARDLRIWAGVKLTPYPNAFIRVGDGLATVRFRTAEDPERMRGPNLSGAWLDEASLMVEDAYKIVIACLREGARMGWLSATFTPKGPTHWTHEVFNTGRPDTALYHAATDDNPFLPPEFEAVLREQYGKTRFAEQELGGRFMEPEGAVFPGEWFSWPGFMVPELPKDGVAGTVLYLDPSWGKQGKGDDQAFVLLHFWPGPNKENLIYLECVPVHEDIIAMVSRGVRLCKDRRIRHWHYEVNGTMGLLDAEVVRQLGEARMFHVRPVPVEHTTASGSKEDRITNGLLPYLKRRAVRILDTPGGRQLRGQLADHPHSTHDDCGDAAAGAVEAWERVLPYGL